MDPETRKKKEGELEQLRIAADAAHQAAADAPGDDALAKVAEDAEASYDALKAELDAAPPADLPSGDEDEEEKDIDFDKELKELEGQDPHKRTPAQRTPLEKAERNLFFSAEEVRKLGGDPDKVVKPKPDTPPAPPAPREESDDLDPRYLTVDHLAEQEAEKLSRSEAETKVILWYYNNRVVRTGNVRADIEDAFYIANKGKIRRSIDEIRRAKSVVPTTGTPAGGRKAPVQVKVPQLSLGEVATMKRRGFVVQADGSWHSKGYIFRYATGKGWVTEAKPKK